MSEPIIVSVSQVNKYISVMIKNESKLQDLYIKGEISNFTNHFKTGHFYFTLKDESSAIKAVMFKNFTESLRFTPENGLAVIVRGKIQTYERDGVYQIYAVEMQPDGVGDLYLAYEQLKEKLNSEGLFAQKRKLPVFPSSICLITAKTGAALQDMLNILGRRYNLAKITLIPALVQGKEAPASICRALQKAQETDADVIICGRGGGSIEDLWAFNDENVARALYASKIPTISAVGHETDFTIADFVADMRAPTPSAAAELAVPDIRNVVNYIESNTQKIKNFVANKLKQSQSKIENIMTLITARSPIIKLNNSQVRLEAAVKQIHTSYCGYIALKEKELVKQIEVVNALSPMNVLMRGFSIVYKGDTIVSSYNDLTVNDNITIKMKEGKATAVVTGTENE